MNLNRYQILSITTVAATILLIFVGGLVRAAGAGLGCPDWPTCFGMWIPPVSAGELPAGYDAEQFNVFHTWLEYFNRLVGVVIGLLISAVFIFSFRYIKTDRVITLSSGIAFILVLFQGWLGGRVVQTGLSTGMITLHMITAMAIVIVLLFTAFRSMNRRLDSTLPERIRKKLMTAGVVLLFLTLIQMILGTQVREMIDVVKNVPEPPPRALWLNQVDNWIYPLHRSFSWLVIISAFILTGFARSAHVPLSIRRMGYIILLLVAFQVLLGAGLEWLGMPGVLQVLHLTGIALLISAIFLHLLMTGFSQSESI